MNEAGEKSLLALLERIASAVEQTASDTRQLKDAVKGEIHRRVTAESRQSSYPPRKT